MAFISKLFSFMRGKGFGKHPLFQNLFYLYAYVFGFYTEVEGMKIKSAVYSKPRRFVLYHTEDHEPHVRKVFCSLIRKGMTVVDVGACVGYTVLASKRVGDNGSVFAFEPDPVRYEALCETVRVNKLKNVKVFNLAVADTDELKVGRMDLDIAATNDQKETVKAMPLDSIVEFADVVKIDVVGHELTVLRSMRRILREGTKIVLEIYPDNLSQIGHSVGEIQDLLERFDYKVYLINPSGLKEVKNILPERNHYLIVREYESKD